MKQLESNVLIVIDNFLDANSDLYREITEDDNWGKFSSFRGWLERDATPDDIWGVLSNRIWKFASELLPSEFEGIEYWRGEIHPGESLNWHNDDDQSLYDKTGESSFPEIGSIYYAHKTPVSEGFLEIQREYDDVFNIGGMERIQPVPNRLVIFDSKVLHRVSPVVQGVRRHFTTNIWKKKPIEENFIK